VWIFRLLISTTTPSHLNEKVWILLTIFSQYLIRATILNQMWYIELLWNFIAFVLFKIY
jgi:hypothetical protein